MKGQTTFLARLALALGILAASLTLLQFIGFVNPVGAGIMDILTPGSIAPICASATFVEFAPGEVVKDVQIAGLQSATLREGCDHLLIIPFEENDQIDLGRSQATFVCDAGSVTYTHRQGYNIDLISASAMPFIPKSGIGGFVIFHLTDNPPLDCIGTLNWHLEKQETFTCEPFTACVNGQKEQVCTGNRGSVEVTVEACVAQEPPQSPVQENIVTRIINWFIIFIRDLLTS